MHTKGWVMRRSLHFSPSCWSEQWSCPGACTAASRKKGAVRGAVPAIILDVCLEFARPSFLTCWRQTDLVHLRARWYQKQNREIAQKHA